MGLRKIKTKGNLIEFYKDWKGVETVFVNNQIVSKKFSFSGTDHLFKIFSRGIAYNYLLVSKMGSIGQTLIDLKCNGKYVKQNLWVIFGTKQIERNKYKAKGIKELNDFDVDEAIEYLDRALNVNGQDPEIYFYLACCHSINENKEEAFECIRKAIKNKLANHDMILENEMLAYLRTQKEFEDFKKSNYTKYAKPKS